MAELKTPPLYEQPMNYEATPLTSGDGIDFHAASEKIGTYAQGHALAQAAALDQRLATAEHEVPASRPEVVFVGQASKLLMEYRRHAQEHGRSGRAA